MGRFDWNRIGRIGQERGEGGGGGGESLRYTEGCLL